MSAAHDIARLKLLIEAMMDDDGDDAAGGGTFYLVVSGESTTALVALTKAEGKWHERCLMASGPDRQSFGGKTYMSYLTPADIVSWFNKDFGGFGRVLGPFDSKNEAELVYGDEQAGAENHDWIDEQ